jgi:GAF domain-containing protein
MNAIGSMRSPLRDSRHAPDGAFDRITGLAARIFDVPISIVSIVDSVRIWFKSRHGVGVDEIGRGPGRCASAILQYEPWVVTDASVDPRTLASPLVVGELGLRFYAGVPLMTKEGHNLGTLNVIRYRTARITAWWQGPGARERPPPLLGSYLCVTSPCSTSPRQAPVSWPRASIISLKRSRSLLTRRSSAPTAEPN